ncbi:MAG: hypothetical protein JWM02_2911 [Frankiales bacterium]|nr:hypothetical protein [Frankiales bacterium]
MFLGTVLLVGAFGLDRWQERRELGALLRCVTSAQADIVYSEGKILATVHYTSPQLTRESTPPAVRSSLQELVKATARAAGPVLRTRRAECARETVVPWHDAQQNARTSYLAYLDARVAYLDALGADVGELFESQPAMDRRLVAARAAVLAAVPASRTGRTRALFGP